MIKNILAPLLEQHDFESNKARFSKKIGLSKETLMQILMGNTKNPGIYTMAKIADALNVSLDNLIGRHTPNLPSPISKVTVKNLTLLEEVVSYVVTAIKPSNKIDMEKFLNCIREVYRFSCKKNALEKDFANWYIETYLKTH